MDIIRDLAEQHAFDPQDAVEALGQRHHGNASGGQTPTSSQPLYRISPIPKIQIARYTITPTRIGAAPKTVKDTLRIRFRRLLDQETSV